MNFRARRFFAALARRAPATTAEGRNRSRVHPGGSLERRSRRRQPCRTAPRGQPPHPAAPHSCRAPRRRDGGRDGGHRAAARSARCVHGPDPAVETPADRHRRAARSTLSQRSARRHRAALTRSLQERQQNKSKIAVDRPAARGVLERRCSRVRLPTDLRGGSRACKGSRRMLNRSYRRGLAPPPPPIAGKNAATGSGGRRVQTPHVQTTDGDERLVNEARSKTVASRVRAYLRTRRPKLAPRKPRRRRFTTAAGKIRESIGQEGSAEGIHCSGQDSSQIGRRRGFRE